MSLCLSSRVCASRTRTRRSFACVRGRPSKRRGVLRRITTEAMGGQHEIDPKSQPYAPSKLSRKEDISIRDFFQVDIRVGTIVAVLDFPEMRKPSYKIEV